MRLIVAFVTALLACASAPASATAQQPDILFLDGKQEPIFTNPLEPFLARRPTLRPESPNTANWRGYVATFRIRDGALWLERVEVSRYLGKVDGEHKREIEDALPRFFPGKREVLADWYTGVLLIPRGKMIDYVHMGYGSTYERYVLLEIRAGKLAGRQDMTAGEFDTHRRRMFEAYKRTPAYRRQLADIAKSGMDAKQAERFLFEYESANYLTQSLEADEGAKASDSR